MNPLCSIRSRLLGLVLAAVIPLAGLIAGGVWSQWESDRAAVAERAINEARLLAAQVDDHISDLESLLAVLGPALSTDPADRLANDALLRKVKVEASTVDSHILLFAPDGTNIGSSADPNYPRPNAGNRTYFREAMAGHSPAVGDPIRVRSGRWVINVARPIRDEAGQIRAVLTVGPVLDHFQDTLKLRTLPFGSAINIVNSKGTVVAWGADERDQIGRQVTWTHLQSRLAAKEGSDLSRWRGGGEIDRVNGFSMAHRVPWLVTVGVPIDIAYAALVNRLKWSAMIVIATLTAAFGVAWWLSGRIVRPLQQLGRDAAVLAAGEFVHRTAVATRDEVGALAANFNQMAEALERRRQLARKARSELRQAKDTLATVVDTSHVAIVCLDPDKSIVLWSRGAEQMFGYAAGEVLGRRGQLVPPEEEAAAAALLARALGGEALRDVQVKRRRKDGTLLDVMLAAAAMHNPDGTVRNVAFAYEDITDRRIAEEQLKRLAHYDQLTGLPNRALLQKELEQLLGGEGGASTAVALFDLDEFKDVNDTLGHSTGDQLLVEVGRRLIAVAQERPLVRLASRLGGDEFVVVIPGCGDPRVISEIVDLLLKRLTEPFIINDQLVHLGASAGIAIAPNDGASVDELIANADLALYQAKAAGRRSQRFFMPVLRAQAQARRNLGLDLRRGFERDEFEIHFQPQVRLVDNAVVGAEALLRWRHPQRGLLLPGTFIDALAESAIASEVGRWIIRAACKKAAAWRAVSARADRRQSFPVASL
jgi:diguanylate cyclase (GGDEF)-like protein/PAS domain S-box-containing protein